MRLLFALCDLRLSCSGCVYYVFRLLCVTSVCFQGVAFTLREFLFTLCELHLLCVAMTQKKNYWSGPTKGSNAHKKLSHV